MKGKNTEIINESGLLDRYYQGETSPDEERELCSLFPEDSLPGLLERASPVPPDGLELRITASIDRQVYRNRRRWWMCGAAAAVVAVVLSAVKFLPALNAPAVILPKDDPHMRALVITDSDEAMVFTMRVLDDIGEQLHDITQSVDIAMRQVEENKCQIEKAIYE